mmetsp:Transcript_77568/g.225127  ORF Transcript_77568/g.225127 Transcript_77568/m.225127 type:complete len:348 (+) Transcript_77568:15-1058(+)
MGMPNTIRYNLTVPNVAQNLMTSTTDTLHVRDLSRLQWAPLPTLVVSDTKGHESKNNHVLAGVLLTLLSLRLGGPVQELSNITSLLRDGGNSTILIFNTAIVQRRRHRNSTTREVRIVVKTRHHFLSSGGLTVSSKKGKDVVVSAVTSLDHQTQIRWVSTTIGGTSSFLVGVRRRDLIIWLTGTLEHFSSLVGSIQDIDFLRHLLDFFGSVGHSNQLTESNVLKRVTRSTNFTVNLESTSKSTMVERGEISSVTPRVVRRVHKIFLIQKGNLGSGGCRKSRSSGSQSVLSNQSLKLRGHDEESGCEMEMRLLTFATTATTPADERDKRGKRCFFVSFVLRRPSGQVL